MYSPGTEKTNCASPRPTSKEHTIAVKGGETFELREDRTLLDGLQSANVDITAACGGRGKCGKCTVTIVQGTVSEVGRDGVGREYDVSPEAPRDVLSCRAMPLSDLVIELKKKGAGAIEGLGTAIGEIEIEPLMRKISVVLPASGDADKRSEVDRLSESLGIEVTLDKDVRRELSAFMPEGGPLTLTLAQLPGGPEVVKVERGCAVENQLGLAVDIGTTTVACALFDLKNGKLTAESSMYNKQMSMGADVISRITYSHQENGLNNLQEAVVETINKLIEQAAGAGKIDPSSIGCMVVSGNTTMLHLLHGLDPWGIGQAPFIPVTNAVEPVKAKTLKIHIDPDAYVYSTPCMSAYIGGDITSDLLASGILREQKKSLLIDFGTNGEMVLSNGDRILTASCAMGPAFEGASISCGMNGRAGAIEKYRIDPDTKEASFSVIGGGIPEGVCGSGLIDILAELKRNGIVNEYGRFIEGSSKYVRRNGEGMPEYLIASGVNGDVVLSEKDTSELLTAKAALAAGVQVCLKEMGISAGELERIIVAGGFGKHINLDNAIEIGLLPEAERKIYEFMGNGSLKGAARELLNEKSYLATHTIARQKVENIQLEQYPGFVDMYVDNMILGA